jgi:hypothetical protein
VTYVWRHFREGLFWDTKSKCVAYMHVWRRVLYVVTACTSEEFRRFKETCRFYVPTRTLNPSKKPAYLSMLPSFTGLLLGFILRPWRWKRHVPSKRRVLYEVRDATTEETAVLRCTAVITSNPTCLLFPHETFFRNYTCMSPDTFQHIVWGSGLDSTGSQKSPVADFCEHGNKLSGSI